MGVAPRALKGYPNLNDDDWVWGGTLADIQKTILHGIRSDHDETRNNAMPRFGVDEVLEKAQINDVTEYVLSLSGLSKDAAATDRGKTIFTEQCIACHGETGSGNSELGAPNLADSVWLFGSTKADVAQSIHTGRGGKMPAWEGRLDPLTIKALTVYVHSLGGGQ